MDKEKCRNCALFKKYAPEEAKPDFATKTVDVPDELFSQLEEIAEREGYDGPDCVVCNWCAQIRQAEGKAGINEGLRDL